jgi:hypothetical protein
MNKEVELSKKEHEFMLSIDFIQVKNVFICKDFINEALNKETEEISA